MNNFNYGSDPVTVTCFHCRNVVVTRTIESTNALCCFLYVVDCTKHIFTESHHVNFQLLKLDLVVGHYVALVAKTLNIAALSVMSYLEHTSRVSSTLILSIRNLMDSTESSSWKWY